MSRAIPIGSPTIPSQAGSDGGRQDRGRHEERPQAGQQVAEVLADADPEQSVERGEHDLDASAGSRRRPGPSAAAT